MVGLAETIIDKMTGKFEPQTFEDRYEKCHDRVGPLQGRRAARCFYSVALRLR
jgi:hypothetical protein